MSKPPLTRRPPVLAGALALLCAVYVVTAKLGLQLEPVSGFATFVWPSTGLALVSLVVFGRVLWPAIAVGAFIVNLTAGAPIAVACGMAIGNTLEAVVGATILERLRFETMIARVRDALVLVLGAALVTTAISATIGVGSLLAGGVIDAAAVWPTWRAWWIGDALGDLIVAPLLFVWLRTPRLRPTLTRSLEAVIVVALTALSSLYVFEVILPRGTNVEEFRTPYLVFPFLIWAALRFRQLGATAGVLVVWIVALIATVLGFGPFAAAQLSESLLPLQLFMGVIAIAMLFLAAAVSERDRAIAARDEFLAIASHELRTPLAALDLQIANLRELAHEDELPKNRLLTKLDVLERQCDRMGALVANLLDVSRIMAGRFELDNEPLAVGEVLREVIVRAREQATKAGCELNIEISDVPPVVMDRLRLEQIATNLLSNAIKFSAGKPIDVSLAASPTALVLTVRDGGIGISADDHARVFERFERAAVQRVSTGLGLGLWIVRQIVSEMGGSIRLDSKLGHGAEFTVTLPRTSPPTP